MRRVCIIRHYYYPQHAHVRKDAEALVEHGYDVDVICLRRKGQPSQETLNGVKIYRLPIEFERAGLLSYIFEYSAFFLLVFWRLTWLSLKRRYQVVEVDSPPDFLVFATIVCRLLGAKVILYVFDHMPELFAEKFMTGPHHIGVRLLRIIERASAGWVDHVIVANAICQKLLEGRGIRSSKLSVVLNVPDEKFFRYQPSLSSSQDGFCIITHGSLLYKYGVQTLIRAVPLLRDIIPELEIKVLGQGEYRHTLEKLVQSLGVEDYVHFINWVPSEKVSDYITQAHVGAVCIIAHKNPMLPAKLFEYLALGKPTLVTSIPAIKAYFDDSSVMFYEPGNEHDLARCVLELYRSPAKRVALASFGLAIYQRYRWPVMKYEYLKVFDRLTGGENRNIS